ncbi:hypothetical protein BASA81_005840 [Batrachochytrium salamandrivorans]|nr:hypothetical protein BASA81_005840 [Batrachochytrium salamandrivorans]
MKALARPWASRMSEERFSLLKRIIDAPSPVNLEGAMTKGVLEPVFQQINPNWKRHRFLGSASLVVDSWTNPDKQPKLTVMVVGHADKIRMQVRHIEQSTGKVYIDSDSYLPIALLGQRVSLFSEKPHQLGSFIRLQGTVEALGAIHFGDAAHRSGGKGVSPDMLYLDFGQHGKDAAKRIEALGVKAGDSVLMDSPLRRALADDMVQGAYLDNGIGSFVCADLARVLSLPEYAASLNDVRVLFAIAGHEEIGRFGSRVLANQFNPDVLVAVDVNHDYVNAPGVGAKRFPKIDMAKGFTLSVGAVCSRKLNELIQTASKRAEIPVQLDCVGRDTGTDGMAGVLAAIDCAVASVGVPTRNMHTSSEAASTKDIDACLFGLAETIKLMSEEGVTRSTFLDSHVDLSQAELVTNLPPAPPKDENKKEEEA